MILLANHLSILRKFLESGVRLSEKEIEVFKAALDSLGKPYKLYLFGSRVDDGKRGGDIDLLVVSKELTKRDLRRVRVEFFKHFGEQKVDIILDNGKPNPFIAFIKQNKKRLNYDKEETATRDYAFAKTKRVA